MQSGTQLSTGVRPRPDDVRPQPADVHHPKRRDRVLVGVNIAIGAIVAYLMLFPLGMLLFSLSLIHI